jgi:hypothetical protein
MKCHPVDSGEASPAERISDIKNLLNWNCGLDNANDREDNFTTDIESHIEQDNGMEDPECLGQLEVSATQILPDMFTTLYCKLMITISLTTMPEALYSK